MTYAMEGGERTGYHENSFYSMFILIKHLVTSLEGVSNLGLGTPIGKIFHCLPISPANVHRAHDWAA
jgi:hypothetical protein